MDEQKGRLNMSENLWEEDPKIQQYVAMKLAEKFAKAPLESLSERFTEAYATSFAQGYAEGLVIGKLQGMRKAIVILVAKRFPILGEFVQFQLQKIINLDTMEQLLDRIIDAENELAVLLLLNDAKA